MSAFYYIQLLATTLDQIWNLFATTQWIFEAQNVVIFRRQLRYDRYAILATGQWTLRNVGNCVMMQERWWHLCDYHVFSIPTNNLLSLCVACIILQYYTLIDSLPNAYASWKGGGAD
jgi:hypothetical protein